MADDTQQKEGETPDMEPESLQAQVGEQSDDPAVPEEELSLEAADVFAPIRRAITLDRLDEAENLLEQIEERGAEWYYQRSLLCRKKRWYLESYRSMKEALRLDPENEHYQEVMEELEKIAGIKEEENGKRKKRKKHMGSKGYPGTCGEAYGDGCGECCAELCCVGSCQCLCEGLGSGC